MKNSAMSASNHATVRIAPKRHERLSGVGRRNAATAVYALIHEGCEHRRGPTGECAVAVEHRLATVRIAPERHERLVAGGHRNAATAVYGLMHEDCEYRRTPATSRVIALEGF